MVTGASSGIGLAIAILFALKGYKVALADIDPKGGTEPQSLIEQKGGETVFIKTDVSNPKDVEKAVS